ncbi:hypothetical protein FF100_18335 [Methylobacterium terricola]|uniref:Solute-binding protein family 3/N-terminal domain-containing protein n=1 Tax=Methylobacterium terricola TaxID=2583531 RepID=A0A5C4LFT0_9HYPH|nr:NrtA/SsuA/CpmA family ABC transporter substrate-binding protein [Methylobacterium terricola]TNC11608.1 hypothetical protein FF100_18335 [Methylobacterium terricola]
MKRPIRRAALVPTLIASVSTLIASVSILIAPALLAAGAARAQQAPAKMTIATGVDPSFAPFYVAKEAGIFSRNGLDVQVNTGPSGSAMVAFLIGNQINAAYGAEQAGVSAHAVDDNVVVVADGTELKRWISIVGSAAVPDLAALKGKTIGIARGTGSETFWLAAIKAKGLDPADYRVVNVEAPEMVAALERGNIDAFAVWEPWPTRAIGAVKGAKVLLTNEGIINVRNFVYMNRGWATKNPDASRRFVTSLVEAADRIKADPGASVAMVAKFLKQPPALVGELMPKVDYTMNLSGGTLANIAVAIDHLKGAGKLTKPVQPAEMIMPELMREVRPAAVALGN